MTVEHIPPASVFLGLHYFCFSFSYSSGGIFVLILTFLYVDVIRLMTTLSKSVKVKNAVSATYLLPFKNRLHFSFNAECDGSVSEIPA